MTRIFCTAVLMFAALWCMLPPAPVAAQAPLTLQNSQVDIAYLAPSEAKFEPIYDQFKNFKVLEELRLFLAPLRLPRKLAIKIDQCGAAEHFYSVEDEITICYELIDEIKQLVEHHMDRDVMLVGTFVQLMLYNVSLAAFDILEVPIWGRTTDAADRLAALLMVEFDEDIALTTIMGVSKFFMLSNKTWTGSDFTALTSPEAQRSFNYLCIAYGSNPKTFSFLVANENEILPKNRAERCADEYQQVRMAFYLRIMPYVDPDLMTAVRARRWPIIWPQK